MTLRRDFLAFSAGAVAAKTVLPLAAKAEPIPHERPISSFPPSQHLRFNPHPDATILIACEAFMEAHLEYEASNHTDVSDEEGDRIFDAWHDALDVVTTTRAKTHDGLKAKARATIAAFQIGVEGDLGETVEQGVKYHELLAWRLAHDVLLGSPA